MNKKIIASALALAMCLPVTSNANILNANSVQQEEELKIERSNLNSFSPLSINFKSDEELEKIKEIYVNDTKLTEKTVVRTMYDLENNEFWKKTKTGDTILYIKRSSFNKGDKIKFVTDKKEVIFTLKENSGDNILDKEKVIDKNSHKENPLPTPSVPSVTPSHEDITFKETSSMGESYYETNPKDKILDIKEVFVDNKKYEKYSSKWITGQEKFFVNTDEKQLYLGRNVENGKVIKLVFNDSSSICFKKENEKFTKVEENNTSTPSVPSVTPSHDNITFKETLSMGQAYYETNPKDKILDVKEVFVDNKKYEKYSSKWITGQEKFFVNTDEKQLYLGRNVENGKVIKLVFNDSSSICFKKENKQFTKVEDNTSTPSVPSVTPSDEDISLKFIKDSILNYNKYEITPKSKLESIDKVFVDDKEYQRKDNKLATFGAGYFIDKENLYLGTDIAQGQVIKFVFKDGTCIFFEKNNNDVFVKVDNPSSKKYSLRIVGDFEAAIIGQQKYDAVSSATLGSVTANKNSNVKLQIATVENPQDKDYKDATEVTHALKLEAKIYPQDSGMTAEYSKIDNSIKLSGVPTKKGKYKVFVQTTDKKIKSNELIFEVFDSDEVTLEERLVDKEFKSLQHPKEKKQWDMIPWTIKKFGKNKNEINVPTNLKLWFGSRESGKYSNLGYAIKENEQPTQTLVVTGELYLINMKILSSVNIVVKDGGKLNLSDSSVYGKVTVENGGTLEINYDNYHSKFSSGSSINGQIILKDGATLQNSIIYSNANALTDGKDAKHIQTPVVSVQGNATIKGNVFIRGDEAPTGEKYKGQGAMEIVNGKKLTIDKNSKLALFAGGRYQYTSNGGDSLKLDGTIDGDGTLVAVGGNGRWKGKGGFGISGNGTIAVDNAYIRGENSYLTKNSGSKAIADTITVDPKTKGNLIDGKNSNNNIEDSKLLEETPSWNGYSAPDSKLLSQIAVTNKTSIIKQKQSNPSTPSGSGSDQSNPSTPSGSGSGSGSDQSNPSTPSGSGSGSDQSNPSTPSGSGSGSDQSNPSTPSGSGSGSDQSNPSTPSGSGSSSDEGNQDREKIIEFIKGENQTFIKEEDKKLIFELNDDVKNFKDVYVDKKIVDKSMYKVTSGSTIIEFTKEFTDSLEKGKHEFKFNFKDAVARTTIHVLDKNKKKADDKKKADNKKKADDKKLPKTNVANSSMLLMFSSLIGFIFSKKEK